MRDFKDRLKHNMRYNQREYKGPHDHPVDSTIPNSDGDDDYTSDLFELRSCYRCGAFLPSDEPADLVGEDDVVCCKSCLELYH